MQTGLSCEIQAGSYCSQQTIARCSLAPTELQSKVSLYGFTFRLILLNKHLLRGLQKTKVLGQERDQELEDRRGR